jgi:UDP-N-acetylglucosamine--N-acetylmuramyl-(pentapeptide) pyrophosphoryl-undecaprenol N-acetylglucosamine transferase
LRLRVAFAGGGTGGHIYPALGIDDALREAFTRARYERCFFGSRRGLEAKLVTTMPLRFVPSAPLQRRLSFDTLRTLARNVAGVTVALRALLAYRPTLVIATGGYVCFPVVVAARLLRLVRLHDSRIALLEINAAPGLTNRLLGPLVDEVWISYAGSARFFGAKAKLTGAPVRASLANRVPAAAARVALGLEPDRTTIVVMGGSQGAHSINAAVAEWVTSRALPAGWQILQISGERDHAEMARRQTQLAAGNVVRLLPYLADPGPAYFAADLAVTRAGASTLAELAATATPAVLVPFPFAAEDHQTANAEAFAAGGAGVVLPDAQLNAESLAVLLSRCLESDAHARMRAAAALVSPGGAAAKIVERITALLGPRVADSGSPNELVRD